MLARDSLCGSQMDVDLVRRTSLAPKCDLEGPIKNALKLKKEMFFQRDNLSPTAHTNLM